MKKASEIKDFSVYMNLDTVPSTEEEIKEVEDTTSKNEKKEIVYKF